MQVMQTTEATETRSINRLVDHDTIDELERELLRHPDILIDMPVTHLFTPGMYVREIFNPAGTLLTTKVHKTEHPFALMKGKVSIFTPGSSQVEHLIAPYIGVTVPGTRRVMFVHEDVIWITFHANPDNEQDLDKLEERIIERRELQDGKTAYELSQVLIAARQLAK